MQQAVAAIFAIVLMPVLLGGCTTIPSKVTLDAPKITPLLVPIDLRDARPMQSLVPESSSGPDGTVASHKFGDEQFEPRVLTVLRAHLAVDLGEQLGNTPIVVNEIIVRFTQVARPRSSGSVYVPSTPGMSAGGNFLAGLIAGGIIGGIESARADRYVFCHIEATVDGKPVTGLGRQSVGMSEVEAGAKTAVLEAIGALVRDIREKLAAPTEGTPAIEEKAKPSG